MFKFIVILCIGIAIGYSYGFRDAKINTDNVVERIVARVGGSNRENVKTDVDEKFKGLER
ncbi:MAG: hypothetical protein H7Z74_07410 [Anaerolineae bacterium]|nr:hypothetical protein [Gemmatimonadaceae bacterium]